MEANLETREISCHLMKEQEDLGSTSVEVEPFLFEDMSGIYPNNRHIKPGFTNYQPQPKYSWAISKIEGKPKGKVGKTKTSERDLKNYRRLTEFGQGYQNLALLCGRLKLTVSDPCLLYLPQQWAKFC